MHESVAQPQADASGLLHDVACELGIARFDAEWEWALAGVMLSQSRGTGGYRLDAAMGDDAGKVESDLTSVYPYARMALTERVSAWGLAGAGSGTITLKPEGKRTMKTGLSTRMAAAGAKGQVLDGTGPLRLAVNVRTDAMWVGTKSDALALDPSGEFEATRRLVTEMGYGLAVPGSTGVPTPYVGLSVGEGGGRTMRGGARFEL